MGYIDIQAVPLIEVHAGALKKLASEGRVDEALGHFAKEIGSSGNICVVPRGYLGIGQHSLCAFFSDACINHVVMNAERTTWKSGWYAVGNADTDLEAKLNFLEQLLNPKDHFRSVKKKAAACLLIGDMFDRDRTGWFCVNIQP